MPSPPPTPDDSGAPPDRLWGASWRLLGAQALFPITGLITAGVLSRGLGVEGYGHFTLAASTVAWVELSIASLLQVPTVQWVSRAGGGDPHARVLLRTHLELGVAAALGLALAAPALARLWGDPAIATTLRLFALDLPLFCLARGYGSVLAGRARFGQQALAIASRWSARLLLTVGLLALGWSIAGAVLAAIGASVVELAVAGRRGPRPAGLWPRTPLPGWWTLAGPLFASALALRVLQLDLVLLRALGAGPLETGWYAAAHNLALAPVLVASVLAGLFLAGIGRARARGDDASARRLGGVAIRLALAAFPVAALLSASAEGWVRWIFGDPLAPASALFAVLILGAAGVIAAQLAMAVTAAAGAARRCLGATLPAVVPALVAYGIWVPTHGAAAAAWITAAAALGCAGFGVATALRSAALRVPRASLARSILFTPLAFAASRAWALEGAALLVEAGVLVLALGIAYALAGELDDGERRALRAAAGRVLAPRGRPH